MGLQVHSFSDNGTNLTLSFLNLSEDPESITTSTFVVEDLGESTSNPPASITPLRQTVSSVSSTQEFDGTRTLITFSSALLPNHLYRLTHFGILDFEENLLLTPPLEFVTPTFTPTSGDDDDDDDSGTVALLDIATQTPTSAFAGTTILVELTGSSFGSPITATFTPNDGLTLGSVTVLSSTMLQFPLQIAPDGLNGLSDSLDFLDSGNRTLTLSGGTSQSFSNALRPILGTAPEIIIGSPLASVSKGSSFRVPINVLLTALNNSSGESDVLASLTLEVSFDPDFLTVPLSGLTDTSSDGGTGLLQGTSAPFNALFATNSLKDDPPDTGFSTFTFSTVTNTSTTLDEALNLATLEFNVLSNAPSGTTTFSVSVTQATGVSGTSITLNSFNMRSGIVTVP